jgi:hypothetical protein
LVVVLLLTGAVVWAAVRGLHYYGLAPTGIYYDLDQPPALVFLVGLWFALRIWRTRP